MALRFQARAKRRPTPRRKNISELIVDNDLRPVDGLEPEERRLATRNRYSPVVLAMTLLATLGVFAYALFLLNPDNRGDLLPWLMVIVAETILVFHALMSMWTMLAGYGKNPSYAFFEAQRKLYDPARNQRTGVADDPTQWPLTLNGARVSVDVHITVYGEPIDVIRRTVQAAQAIRGLHDTYVLDDGNSDDVRDLAAQLRCGYIRRLSNAGAKAGNVNNALSVAKGDFFVILDADFVAEPEFLEETLPHMTDANVAFVQTPQTYGNMTNIISRGAGYMQNMFYRFIQPGRNEFNAAFCVGTNVLFRRAAIAGVGGYNPDLIAGEEPDLCLRMRQQGWRVRRIDAEMTLHDAAMTHIRQWWRRSERSGHAFAEHVQRHGAKADSVWRQQVRSILAWGVALPLVILAAGLALGWWAAGLVALLYPLQVARIARRMQRGRGYDRGFALRYAHFLVLGKFAQAKGVLGYHVKRLTGRRSTLIEYKGA